MIIESIHSYRQLDIDFVNLGSFQFAQNSLKDKAQRAMFIEKQPGTSPNSNLSTKLFASLVVPIIRYCSEIWCPFFFLKFSKDNLLKLSEDLLIENVQTKFCKYILGVHRKSTNIAVKSELGRFPLAIDLLHYSVKYQLALCKYDTNTFADQSLLECYKLTSQGKNNWLKPIKLIIENLGFGETWNNFGSLNPMHTNRIVKSSLVSLYENKWLDNIGKNTGKLRTYFKFKTKFELENYISTTKKKDFYRKKSTW